MAMADLDEDWDPELEAAVQRGRNSNKINKRGGPVVQLVGVSIFFDLPGSFGSSRVICSSLSQIQVIQMSFKPSLPVVGSFWAGEVTRTY